MKKTLSLTFDLFLIVMMLMLMVNPVSSKAVESKEVPQKMLPYSKIEYVSETEFIILSGGTTEESLLKTVEEEKLSGVVYEEKLKPFKGLIVVYGSDGLLFDYVGDVAKINPSSKEIPSGHFIVVKSSLTECDRYYLLYSWGAFPNRLYRCEKDVMVTKTEMMATEKIMETYPFKTIVGSGRATTFDDDIGQGNIVLKKGDVATKLEYDNIPLNSYVKVTAQKKTGGRLSKSMIKNDAGDMPNAIIDIWKTGVEYWGYTYSTSLSLPGETWIQHGYFEN